MINRMTKLTPFLIICAALTAQVPENTRWITPPNPELEVDGLPLYAENNGDLVRLPIRLEKIWVEFDFPGGQYVPPEAR